MVLWTKKHILYGVEAVRIKVVSSVTNYGLAIVIDPGEEADKVNRVIQENGLTISNYIYLK